jgi:hypothetical protein
MTYQISIQHLVNVQNSDYGIFSYISSLSQGKYNNLNEDKIISST